jgi:hypothetical protein
MFYILTLESTEVAGKKINNEAQMARWKGRFMPQ